MQQDGDDQRLLRSRSPAADLPEAEEKNRERRDERESPNPGHRDLSIRYPGMTTQSFDKLLNLLDEVLYEGRADLPQGEDEEHSSSISRNYGPVQDIQNPEPVQIPTSPPHVGVELIVPGPP